LSTIRTTVACGPEAPPRQPGSSRSRSFPIWSSRSTVSSRISSCCWVEEALLSPRSARSSPAR